MQKQNISFIRTVAIAALLVCAAMLCRFLGKHWILPTFTGFVRSFIYVGLFGAWGVSVWRRIVQKRIQRYLLVISGLLIFWMTVRTIKYNFAEDLSLIRLMWYSYYIPMQFVPLLALFVALLLGKSENYHLPKWTALLFIPTTAFVLLVLTNDLHQLIFTFPPGTTLWSDSDYGYNIGYWMAISWEILCAGTAIITMLVKCRVPRSRKALWLPLLPFSLLLLYGLAYAIGLPGLMAVAGDIAAVQCLFYAAAFESCIQCGLIQSNTGYDALFPVSTVCAQIVDKNYDVRYSSASASEVPKSMLMRTAGGAVSIDRVTLLKGQQIRAGFVVWQEDITELVDAIDELSENQKEIAHANDVERENYNAKRLISQLREKNRLYDLLQEQTAKQNELLSGILDAYYESGDELERRELLKKAAVIGAYIKRRGNLVILREQSELLPVSELSLCLNESMQNLELMNVNGETICKLNGTVATESAIRIYDLFEAAVEATLGALHGILVHLSHKGNDVTVRIEIVSDTDLAALDRDGVTVRHVDDGTWTITLRLPKGGAAA